MIASFLASRARKEAAQPLSAAAGVGRNLQDGFELWVCLSNFFLNHFGDYSWYCRNRWAFCDVVNIHAIGGSIVR